MKRTMMYLPDELHKDLKRLAVERETSLAELIREAARNLTAGGPAADEVRERPSGYGEAPGRAARTARYKVVIQRSRFGFHVECPALPGCVSQGSTREEALDNVKDAIRTYLSMIEDEVRAMDTAEVTVGT